MADWYDPKVKLPEDGEQCLLMPHERGGLVTTHVFGPMPWNAKNGCWLDIFATPEAGEMVDPAQVGCWTLWAPIAPAEGLPTPFEAFEKVDAEPQRQHP
jgi:hypothetical protein